MQAQYFAPITAKPSKLSMACYIIQVTFGLRFTPAANHPNVCALMRKTHWMVAEKFAAAKSARRASA
ncbi:MAG: hypothetical protein COA84_15245 [Robiginitomaculum sp.]|nr:MAG: hypothetical protein COA84_15245 [Robiginitomaculum sp.]